MIFSETTLKGVYLIGLQRMEDDRGFFARTWCRREFKEAGIDVNFVQCNISYNIKKGTLRGLHYQVAPYGESKLVRCTSGAIHDVIADLRPESATFKKWMSVELSQENQKALFIPKGFAHGFLTLADNTEVFYQMSEFYEPGYAKGVRWNDPAFAIHWPAEVRVISEKDSGYRDFVP
jgi:dTDP-4-dehydrorhamnose 3,5-epimerase